LLQRPCVSASAAAGALELTGPSTSACEPACGPLGFQTGFGSAFTLGRHIGSGAYGVVNLCVDRRTGREYACKVLPKVRGRLTPAKTAKKIWQEVELLSRVQSCGNVARLQSVFEDDERVYIVLELCQGGDLEQLLEDHGPLTERQAALVLYECLKVVAECHGEGLVHGDVKPANFLLKQRMRNPLALIESGSVRGWLKAIDFGCSQDTRGAQLSRRTGTPVYMAPEVFQREYGTAADMWSLGMMLFQFMTCRFPFWSSLEACREKSLDQVMKSVIVDDITFDHGPWLHMSPEGLDLLQGLFERNPVERMTAREALAHPWFQQQLKRPPLKQRSNIVPLESARSKRSSSGKTQPVAAAAAAAAMQKRVATVGRSYAGSWADAAANFA
jgi:calcium-dependent protein kinase